MTEDMVRKFIMIFHNSDSVGNKGALINITPDMKLDYKTFEAVVSDKKGGGWVGDVAINIVKLIVFFSFLASSSSPTNAICQSVQRTSWNVEMETSVLGR